MCWEGDGQDLEFSAKDLLELMTLVGKRQRCTDGRTWGAVGVSDGGL